jgi:hypothetical protein
MRVGGPYKITVSFVGFSNFEDSDVYLQLGENKTLKINLAEESNQLKVIVRGSKIILLILKEQVRKLLTLIRLKHCHLCQEIYLILQD